jgi:membrane-associated phospholipid phosphatase
MRRWPVAGILCAAVVGCAEGHGIAPEFTAGPEVATWQTWVIGSPGAFRPASPPNAGSREDSLERNEILIMQSRLTVEQEAAVRQWDGDPTSTWTRYAVERLDFFWPLLPDVRLAAPVRSARLMALLHVAMHDALVAAWEAKYTWRRDPAWKRDRRVRRLVPMEDIPSYPSHHAAVAAAAATILNYGLPADDTLHTWRMARFAADTRVIAGEATWLDVNAGWDLGRAVARQVLARARADGADTPWTGSVPSGELSWRPTPPRRVQAPFDPLAGNWRPWVIPRGDAFRLPAPPSRTSGRFVADLAELKRLSTAGRTSQQVERARYWATDAPSLRWELFVDQELRARRWTIPAAARARAWVSVAMADAAIACWDSKYAWWLARPVTVDSTLSTVFSTPPFPSYPSGHSTMSTAAAVVMEALFPDAARTYRHLAEEASFSRVWGGVHYRFDVVDGDSLGARVGRAVTRRMRGAP